MIVQLPKPHSLEQQIIMNAFQTPGLLELWVACGSKFGKSISASCALISSYLQTERELHYRWVAPIYSQSKIGFKYVKKMLPPKTANPNNSDLTLTNPHNQAFIEFKSGKYPEDLEGEAIDGGYVLDEFAKMNQQVYDSAKTTLTITRAPMIVISTPRGKNFFHKKCKEVEDEMKWCYKHGKKVTKIFLSAPSTVNPYFTAEADADMKKSLPDRLYRQYVKAEFNDDGTTFIGLNDVVFGELIDSDIQKWYDDDLEKKNVVIGVDWAKTIDYTVFWAVDLDTGKTCAFWRFNKISYTESVRRLVIFSKKFKDVIEILHDKTGVGSAVDDILAHTELPYIGIVFNNANKNNLVTQLMTSIEQKKFFIPQWQTALDELENFEVDMTAAGNITYAGAEGFHDDTVMAMTMANSLYLQYGNSNIELETNTSPLEKYYRDSVDDDE